MPTFDESQLTHSEPSVGTEKKYEHKTINEIPDDQDAAMLSELEEKEGSPESRQPDKEASEEVPDTADQEESIDSPPEEIDPEDEESPEIEEEEKVEKFAVNALQ